MNIEMNGGRIVKNGHIVRIKALWVNRNNEDQVQCRPVKITKINIL